MDEIVQYVHTRRNNRVIRPDFTAYCTQCHEWKDVFSQFYSYGVYAFIDYPDRVVWLPKPRAACIACMKLNREATRNFRYKPDLDIPEQAGTIYKNRYDRPD